MRGRTVIAIAHRLSTVRAFDRIVVLQAGKVVQDGSPDHLMGGMDSTATCCGARTMSAKEAA